MANAKKSTKNDQFDAMASFQPESFKEGYEKVAETMSTLAEMNKSSLEAMMASAGVITKGVEKLSAEQTEFLKTRYEHVVSSMKAVSGAASVQEAMDIQTDLARGAMESNISQVNKVADIVMETTKECVAPISERYSELVERIQAYRP